MASLDKGLHAEVVMRNPAILRGRRPPAHRPPRFCGSGGKMPAELALECVRPPGWESMPEADFRSAERKRTKRRVLGRKIVSHV